jgi:hypothetical protein
MGFAAEIQLTEDLLKIFLKIESALSMYRLFFSLFTHQYSITIIYTAFPLFYYKQSSGDLKCIQKCT